MYASGAEKAQAAWSKAGRDGEPRKVALAYFSLGDRAGEDAQSSLAHYYAWLGEEIAGFIVAGAAKSPEAVREQVEAYDAAGCDELIFCPSSADPDQVDLLAGAAGLIDAPGRMLAQG